MGFFSSFFFFFFSPPPFSFFLKRTYTQVWDCLCNSQEFVEFQFPFKVPLTDLGCRTTYTSKHAYHTQTYTRVRTRSGRPAFSQPLNTSKAHLSVERQALCHMLALQKSDIRGLSRDRATVSQTITAVIYVCHPFIHSSLWRRVLVVAFFPLPFSPHLLSASLYRRDSSF